jgi:predicted AAA+ superfamily ATPase
MQNYQAPNYGPISLVDIMILRFFPFSFKELKNNIWKMQNLNESFKKYLQLGGMEILVPFFEKQKKDKKLFPKYFKIQLKKTLK